MADTYRLIKEEENSYSTILLEFAGGVTVEVGDLIFVDTDDDLRNNGSSTASNYGYPFEYFRLSGSSLTLNKIGVKDYFIGVANQGKDGITDSENRNLTVITSGKFNFDLKPPKTVNAGDMFGASGTSSASDLYNQKVMKVTDTDYALGYFAEKKTHAMSAELYIKNIFDKIS